MFFIDNFGEFGWHFLLPNVLTVCPIEVVGLFLYDVDQSSKSIVFSNGHLHGSTADAQLFPSWMDGRPGIGAHSIQFVDEDDPRDVITNHLLVDSQGLWLDTAYSTQDQYGAI